MHAGADTADRGKKHAVVGCLYCLEILFSNCPTSDTNTDMKPASATSSWLARHVQALLDRIPGNCALCRRLCYAGSLCSACQNALPWLLSPCPHCGLEQRLAAGVPCGNCLIRPPVVDRCVAPLHYRQPVDRLLAGFKFRARFADGRSLALLLADTVSRTYRNDTAPELLLPMPLHRARWRQRGYNQAVEVTRVLRRSLGLPVCATAVVRHRVTAAQTSLGSIAARRRNVAGAFTVVGAEALLECRHVAIVDDVITTMATVNSLAACLRQHGVERVDAWCLARASRQASDTATEQLVNNRGEM